MVKKFFTSRSNTFPGKHTSKKIHKQVTGNPKYNHIVGVNLLDSNETEMRRKHSKKQKRWETCIIHFLQFNKYLLKD